jgi:DNA-binding NarL/FixJ family response regulator
VTTTIIIINRSRLERDLIVRTFNASKCFDAIGCANAKDALSIITETRAEVVIVSMTDREIFSAAKDIVSMGYGAIVVASGVELRSDAVVRCAQAGISGYIEFEASADEWVTTVTAAMNGEVDNPKIAGILLKYLAQETTHTPRMSWRVADDIAQSAKRVGLTPRERQIMGLIDKGLSNKAIANELHVESSTVKNHVHAILQKYGVRHRGEAAARFRETTHQNGAS